MQVEIEHIFIVMAPTDQTCRGQLHTFCHQMHHCGAEVHSSVYPASTPGLFGFHLLCSCPSVSDTILVWISGFKFKPSKIPLAVVKSTGLCVNLSSYNWKVLCLYKEDVIMGFNIFAGFDVPTTIGGMEVLQK